jgi:glycosyltransferase involved in cell wall biosynthesis
VQSAPDANVWVVIPAQNEAETIRDVIRRCRHYCPQVVVVDDASSDRTAALAREAGAVVLPLATSLDAWCAAQTGLRFARARGAQIVVTLDGDGQHPPEAIGGLVESLQSHRADLVIGSDLSRVSKYRQFAWRYLRAVTGLEVADLTSGFRAYGRTAIDVLVRPEATSLNYQDVGVLMMLREAGLRMIEVPVIMAPRLVGASRVFRSWVKVAAYMMESSVIGLARRSRL